MMTLKLALLNLSRNLRRTGWSVLNLVLTLALILIFEGFAESMFDGLRESMIRSQLGHLQVFAKGYNQYGALTDSNIMFSEETRDVLQHRLEGLSGVAAVTARLESDLLITDGQSQMSVHAIGIDPDKEAVISSAVRVIAGSELFSSDASGILLGAGLAQALGVKPGDALTLLGTAANQSLNAVDVTVRGIVTTGVAERDLRLMYANIGLMESFLLSRGATRMVISLKETRDTEVVRKLAESALSDLSKGLELRSWSELAPYYHQVVALFSVIFLFVKSILLLMAGLAISNALSMSVIERTREIGVIRAIGGSRREVCTLFMLEGGFIGIVGALLGLPVAWGIAWGLNHSGWMMPTPPGSTVNYPLRILLTSEMFAFGFVMCVTVAFVASILPALRTVRLNIVSALNHA
jgi:putative ABC transport system permease protein